MPAEFADTNIVIYAAGSGPKAEAARVILRRAPSISVQVLNETLNVFRKKQQLDCPEVERRLARLHDPVERGHAARHGHRRADHPQPIPVTGRPHTPKHIPANANP